MQKFHVEWAEMVAPNTVFSVKGEDDATLINQYSSIVRANGHYIGRVC
jgi:hypothetical protein